jgi:hypothetical protein
LIDECDIDARQSLAVLEEDLERKWKLYKSSDLTLKLWIMSEKKRKKEAEKSSKKANFKARVPSSNTTLLVCSHTSLSFFFFFVLYFVQVEVNIGKARWNLTKNHLVCHLFTYILFAIGFVFIIFLSHMTPFLSLISVRADAGRGDAASAELRDHSLRGRLGSVPVRAEPRPHQQPAARRREVPRHAPAPQPVPVRTRFALRVSVRLRRIHSSVQSVYSAVSLLRYDNSVLSFLFFFFFFLLISL